MALLQIAEPGAATAPHRRRLAAGIDLGTTNSLVATIRSGSAETLPDSEGRHILPSVVHYGEQGVEVGYAAQGTAASDPHNTLSSMKRLIGRGLADVHRLGRQLPYDFSEGDGRVPRIRTRRGEVSPIEVSAEILRVLAQRARDSLGDELDGVVITVPAYFDEAQRQATKDAARLAGLRLFRLLNEPTAAAVAYGLDRQASGVHAVYDLGGGTFDISILRLNRGVFEVLATGGDSALGGDDFDRAVAHWIMQQAGVPEDADPTTQRVLLDAARAAKEALSRTEDTAVRIGLPGHSWAGTLDRTTFEALIDPLVRQTISACRRTLRDAGLRATGVDDVVMVGGSTRVPRVRRMVAELFGREPLVDIDPDRVVAIGAAIQADILAGNKPDSDMLLLDVNPLSLGIETMGGLVERIIPRNTTIPVARAQEFTTFKDGQTAMAIHVLQGERELVSDCRSLARFELRGIPPLVAGAARIRVTFAVDADGLLSVEAEELSQGVKASVTVKPSYGLSDGEIADMLRASMEHARDDMLARRLAEQRVESERVQESLRSALAVDGEALLSAEERQSIETVLAGLHRVTEGDDADAIARAMKELEEVCGFYVERRMNAGIRRALAGHKVEDFSD